MLKLVVEIHGKRIEDIDSALENVEEQVNQGYTSGGEKNNDGHYTFELTGEEESDKK